MFSIGELGDSVFTCPRDTKYMVFFFVVPLNVPEMLFAAVPSPGCGAEL